ncbi:DUF1851 domain-containing protein [Deinococcus sp. Arct2-2]|uniref:GAD-like domain-containing protein n=1 Tax=Deinococcus sp. Arct2-2 TaxID=2568653 RepID=UPI0010A4EF6F|nr:GAD-like domain-containing protein [Deinococcus sp. Arct2-2]THF69207.1 DUF1851 domain-containing protein [Deinococcus sp. Arct2-2]
MDSSQAVEHFLQRHPPTHTRPVPEARAAAYQDILPDELPALWRTAGWGKYGGGLIELIDPADYQDVLNGWLGADRTGTRTPFLLSAFGVLYYWRRLGEVQPDGRYEGYDVAYINPHDSDTGVVAWDAATFLGEYLGADELTYDLDPFDLWLTLQSRAATELGSGMIYGFVPALRLGGEPDPLTAAPVQAPEHLELLRQLAE